MSLQSNDASSSLVGTVARASSNACMLLSSMAATGLGSFCVTLFWQMGLVECECVYGCVDEEKAHGERVEVPISNAPAMSLGSFCVSPLWQNVAVGSTECGRVGVGAWMRKRCVEGERRASE